MMNEHEQLTEYREPDGELLDIYMERDSRRYDKAYTEKDEVKLS